MTHVVAVVAVVAQHLKGKGYRGCCYNTCSCCYLMASVMLAVDLVAM